MTNTWMGDCQRTGIAYHHGTQPTPRATQSSIPPG